MNYAIALHKREALPLQRRQALAHWKDFLERHPDAPEAEELGPKVDSAQARWNRTHRDRAVKVAKRALEHDKVRLALVYADRALRYMPEDEQASELREEAAERLVVLRANQRRSVGAAETEAFEAGPDEARELALALLRPDGDIGAAAQRLHDADPDGPLADEALFASAVALGETGYRDEMWEQLERVSEEDPDRSNMARHAAALVYDYDVNAWRGFREARSRDRWNRFRWVLLGPFAGGARDYDLPRPIEYLIDLPSAAQTITQTPIRLIQIPWMPSFPSERHAAYYAGRYLEREPRGEHSEDARDWLESYEAKQGNWIGAMHIAEESSEPDLEHLAELREKAAAQALGAASQAKNRAMRSSLYRRIGRDFQGTRAADTAGAWARAEAESATPQHIRISRGFLLENPRVAGPEGMGLLPELLDDEASNGEIHPEGVSLLGGRVLEVSYLASSGDEDDPPQRVQEKISEDRLARIVSQVAEISYENTLLDDLDVVAPDAKRDAYFERARLGLTDDVDARPLASSSYAYRGVRERYGMVRSRESILPFDLVLQGSFHDMSLGAFPRIRRPRETPDAILYK